MVKSSLLGGVCKAFIGGKEGSGAGPDEPSEEVGAELRPVRLAAPAAHRALRGRRPREPCAAQLVVLPRELWARLPKRGRDASS